MTKESSNKVLKENNKLSVTISDSNDGNHTDQNNSHNHIQYNNTNNIIISKTSNSSLKNGKSLNLIPSDESQKVNFEYLKNIFIKYLNATAIGNEFQIKILENVIFSLLKINDTEKNIIEEKRLRSSFYYNLWYNARDFLSARIYGQANGENAHEHDQNLGNLEIPEEEEYKRKVEKAKFERHGC